MGVGVQLVVRRHPGNSVSAGGEGSAMFCSGIGIISCTSWSSAGSMPRRIFSRSSISLSALLTTPDSSGADALGLLVPAGMATCPRLPRSSASKCTRSASAGLCDATCSAIARFLSLAQSSTPGVPYRSQASSRQTCTTVRHNGMPVFGSPEDTSLGGSVSKPTDAAAASVAVTSFGNGHRGTSPGTCTCAYVSLVARCSSQAAAAVRIIRLPHASDHSGQCLDQKRRE